MRQAHRCMHGRRRAISRARAAARDTMPKQEVIRSGAMSMESVGRSTVARKPVGSATNGRAPPRARREMTLHQLRIFWAVAHAVTLTEAAKQLGLTQPSLSQQLSKLETTVGTALFDRTPVQMTL